ncbi:MAG: SAM-dependent methyltransferase [Gammaproteobacteria bacterium]|nr:SAM-dependent methyltransferase [Gammaproteobacteria bacterium]MBL6999686.1 SAM-dependent methyltransferase [Gammaproteobacteria bacterium]
MNPLLTSKQQQIFLSALKHGEKTAECSLDLGRSLSLVDINAEGWICQGHSFPYLKKHRERTIYYWQDGEFKPVSRYTGALVKLVPTDWGPPTFEIDGIKMLPTAQISPYTDAQNKVALIQPRGKVILDTCAGLGYFAAWCVQGGASQIISFEKNPDVIWLRGINPWSPKVDHVLSLTRASIDEQIESLASASVDAILHDPPRFGIAGELYSQVFYDQLARVLKPKGRLFHYTGSPNKLTSGRNVPNEVSKRLQYAGFVTELIGDGVLAVKR